MRSRDVIVLNKYGEYWTETNTRRAVAKILKERAVCKVADEKDLLGVVRITQGLKEDYLPVYRPLVIQLKFFDYYYYKSDEVPYSDRQVFIRDQNICQYWHDYELKLDDDGSIVQVPSPRHKYKVSLEERTIDHVIPVSRGGRKSDFENEVCCCRYCNEVIKKNMTPKEAGLSLIKKPQVPKRVKGDRARNLFIFDNKKESHTAYLSWKKQFTE